MRAKIKENINSRKRKVSYDISKLKQTKLEVQSGVLNMKPPPPNPEVQKDFVNALTNFAVESGISMALMTVNFENFTMVLR